MTGRVCVHSVVDGTTSELSSKGDAAILSMGVDGCGRVWLGHQGGCVQVWCSVYHTHITQESHLTSADVRSGCLAIHTFWAFAWHDRYSMLSKLCAVPLFWAVCGFRVIEGQVLLVAQQ